MKVYVLDANAVIRFLSHGPGEEKVAALFERQAKGEARLLISVVNWGEVLYTLARRVGLNQAKTDLEAIGEMVEPEAIDQTQAETAATLKLHYRLGYADCFAAALAIGRSATLVTADAEFAKLGRKLRVLALPRHQR
jgi:predicted nucleic acid-binding protein